MGVKAMFPLAVATSIDALAVGVTFAFLQVNIVLAAGLIGVITFVMSANWRKSGDIFGARYKSRAELGGRYHSGAPGGKDTSGGIWAFL